MLISPDWASPPLSRYVVTLSDASAIPSASAAISISSILIADLSCLSKPPPIVLLI